MHAQATVASSVKETCMRQHDEELRALIERTRRGDREAFSALYQRFEHAAIGLALRLTIHRDDAEEAVQRAAVKFWRATPRLDAEKDARALFLKIVARSAIEILRSKRSEVAKQQRIAAEPPAREAPARAEDTSEHDEALASLRRALELLPGEERRMVTLHYGGGLSQNEIAALLEMPRQTVAYKLQGALGRLRSRLVQAGISSAAAAPLLDGGALSEAICSGHAAAPSLREKILERVGRTSRESLVKAPPHVTTAARLGGVGFYASCAAALALAGGVAWWAYSKQAPVSSPALLNGAPRDANGLNEKSLQNTAWSFTDASAPAEKFRVLYGSWAWTPGEKKGAGAMVGERDKNTSVLLPLKIAERPLRITVTGLPGVGQARKANVGAAWFDGKTPLPYKTWSNVFHFGSYKPNSIKIYFLDRHQVIYWDQHPNRPIALRMWERSYPTSQIVLRFQNYAVRNIEVRALAPEEIPEEIRDWRALLPKMKLGPEDVGDANFSLPEDAP